jgi:RNA polymerase sigma factor (sigma-70 family)
MTSEELYRGCMENDQNAWHYAYNYVISALKQIDSIEQDFEDIAQDTLLYFLSGGINLIENPKAFKSWLRIKARAVVYDLWRKNRIRKHQSLEKTDEYGQVVGENPNLPHVDPYEESRIFACKVFEMLNRSLEAIGQKCEQLLKAYYRAKILGEEIGNLAKELGLVYENMRVQIYRCNQKLFKQPDYRKLLEEYEIQ